MRPVLGDCDSKFNMQVSVTEHNTKKFDASQWTVQVVVGWCLVELQNYETYWHYSFNPSR